jgi:Uma2 family endonuclease
MITLQLQQLDIPLGQRLLIHHLNWEQFEEIITELGESRTARIAYHQETLEIRMPTPEHEIDKEIISDIVKILLEELEIDCECFGSTPFKQAAMKSGIEPDQCFYIQNQTQMRGKRRADLSIDPPPDLAIEVDVTSKTQMEAYLSLRVPELWIYARGELKIYTLNSGEYQQVTTSPTFPGFPLLDRVTAVLTQTLTEGRSPALRAFRQHIRTLKPTL